MQQSNLAMRSKRSICECRGPSFQTTFHMAPRDHVFQNFVFALTVVTVVTVVTVSTDRFVRVLPKNILRNDFVDLSAPDLHSNWKDFLPSNWPQATSTSADCERSTLSFNSRVAVTQL